MIEAKFFDEQIRSLLVARGKFVGREREADIRRFWYEEFKNLDRAAFQKTIQQLKYLGDPNDFPSYQEFKVIYRNIRPKSSEPDKPPKYCGKCQDGKIYFRDYNSHGQIAEYVGRCKCTPPSRSPGLERFDPLTFVKDLDGQFCTPRVQKQEKKPRE